MDEQLKKNISAVSIWVRFIYMVLFGLVLYGAYIVLFVTVFVQFLFTLISGTPNLKLLRFSDILCKFIKQCIDFECFLTEEKPFPFSDLPNSDIETEPTEIDAVVVSDEGADTSVQTEAQAENAVDGVIVDAEPIDTAPAEEETASESKDSADKKD